MAADEMQLEAHSGTAATAEEQGPPGHTGAAVIWAATSPTARPMMAKSVGVDFIVKRSNERRTE